MSYKAQASVVLAHSLQHAGDPEGAAAAFAAAEEALAAAGDGAYLPVLSELHVMKGLFLISQGEYHEAGPLLETGFDIAREVLARLRPEALEAG